MVINGTIKIIPSETSKYAFTVGDTYQRVEIILVQNGANIGDFCVDDSGSFYFAEEPSNNHIRVVLRQGDIPENILNEVLEGKLSEDDIVEVSLNLIRIL